MKSQIDRQIEGETKIERRKDVQIEIDRHCRTLPNRDRQTTRGRERQREIERKKER